MSNNDEVRQALQAQIAGNILGLSDDEGFLGRSDRQYIFTCVSCRQHASKGHHDGCPVKTLIQLNTND